MAADELDDYVESLMERCGIDQVIVLRFDARMALDRGLAVFEGDPVLLYARAMLLERGDDTGRARLEHAENALQRALALLHQVQHRAPRRLEWDAVLSAPCGGRLAVRQGLSPRGTAPFSPALISSH